MKKYRHLFFDLDNTIWDFNLNSYYALKETFKIFKLELNQFENFFEVYTKNNDRLWELYRQNGITKDELSKSRFDLTFKETAIKGATGFDFNREYLMQMPLQTRLCDGAEETLGKLAGKYEMHIITNGFSEVQVKKMENSGLNRFFKKVFVSEEIKSPKPSPGIFRFALKSCNARKKESLMIGDSWEVDVIGAMDVGIDQVHYAPFMESNLFTASERERMESSGTNTFRINHLEELCKII